MQRTFYLLIPIVLLIILQGCLMSGRELPIPDDGGDDAKAIQMKIDSLADSGGGVVQLSKGVYDLSKPLYLRSLVTLKGVGSSTILTNERFNTRTSWHGTTVFAGNLGPASFTYNDGKGYRGHVISIDGVKKITLSECDIDNIAKLAGTVVWLASDESISGRGGFSRPIYNEMNRVERTNDCEMILADPITIPKGFSSRIYWADNSVALHKGLEANRPIHGAQILDLQLRSGGGQTLISSGCYACVISEVTIGKSRRLLGVQGSRNSIYQEITGEFSERGIEITMFANGNTIKNIQGSYVFNDQYDPRPAIRFGEYARNNIIQDVKLDLASKFGLVRIRFNESEFNKIENVRMNLIVEESREVISAHITRLETTMMDLPSHTSIMNLKLCSLLYPSVTYNCEAIK